MARLVIPHPPQATLDRLEEVFDPWPHFLVWESEWHVRLGITKLRQAPFAWWGKYATDVKMVELQQAHPDKSEAGKKTIEADVRFVIAAMRQAKEFYTAGLTVSELTRPVLMYYSATMMAKALAVGLFGTDYIIKQNGHGLTTPKDGVGLDGKKTMWPTCIKWQARGDFVAFYVATRWDTFHADKPNNDSWPTFHILECLRAIGITPSPPMLTNPLSLDHLLWAYCPGQPHILPNTVEHVTQNPVFEVPRVAILYMVLFWLGVMARYHASTWQELLAGKTEEGYSLRLAIDQVPRQFLQYMQEALPSPYTIKEIDRDKVVPLQDPRTLQCSYKLLTN